MKHRFGRWLVAALGFFSLVAPGVSQAESNAETQVLVVPIEEMIDEATVALVQRALREAQSHGVRYVVLQIDTPGGLIVSTREIGTLLNMLSESDIETIAFVAKEALSAGAYIALAAKKTYMAPSATMGAITPVLMGPLGIEQIGDDDARKKAYSAMKADLRALLDRRENMPDWARRVAEAMVDPQIEVFKVTHADPTGVERTEVLDVDDIRAIEVKGHRVIQRTRIGGGSRPLTLTAREAEDLGFSAGTIGSLHELVRDEWGLPPKAIGTLPVSWSERLVKFISGLKPLLFVVGFILLLLEMKTPGFAIPGVLGILTLGVAMFGSYLVGVAEWTEILLFFFGIGLLAVEVFVMPGMLVFGIAGFTCIVFGLILSQQPFVIPQSPAEYDILQSNLINMLMVIIMTMVGAVLMWKILPRVPILGRAFLAPPGNQGTGASTQFAMAGAGSDSLLGRTGEAATDLRPAGIMTSGHQRWDVVADGDFIAAGARLRIVEIEGNRIVVAEDGEAGEVTIGFLIFLMVIGLGLVIAEVFFVSFGILAVLAAVSLISSVFLAFTEYGQGTGFVMLTVAAAGLPAAVYLALKLLPKTGLGKILILSGTELDMDKAGREPGIEKLLGQRGRTISDLRPAGFARIEGKKVDVVTRGEMLGSDVPVTVIEVEGNRVVVAQDHDTEQSGTD